MAQKLSQEMTWARSDRQELGDYGVTITFRFSSRNPEDIEDFVRELRDKNCPETPERAYGKFTRVSWAERQKGRKVIEHGKHGKGNAGNRQDPGQDQPEFGEREPQSGQDRGYSAEYDRYRTEA